MPQVSYAKFGFAGPPFFEYTVGLYVGGLFWDGRAVDLIDQAKFPFLDANEMNNLLHNVASPAMVVQKVKDGPSAQLFRDVFGANVFSEPTPVVYHDIADAIAAYEKSKEVSPFSSKYDAWRAGRATLTPRELNGLRLMTGTWTGRPDGGTFPRFAHCVDCHMNPSVPSAEPDLWTLQCYQNIGVPRNPNNPFYTQTDPVSNPVGYNPLGAAFVDYGLGVTLYKNLGLPPGNIGPGSNGMGDFLGINGQFKAPSLRNVDLRPHPGFVKAYMHNGVFKSLQQVVHFYNTRNLTTRRGEVIDFTRAHPYEGLLGQPLWDPPEYPSDETLVNAEGGLGTLPGEGPGGESAFQVGNLGITAQEEADIVAFLKTLSDGYFNPDDHPGCIVITSQPVPQRVCRGSFARMTVASNLSGKLGYQWFKDGVPVVGANLSFHDVVVADASDTGRYHCVVTAPCGSIASREAAFDVCYADFDCDGKVDFRDLLDFLAAFRAGEQTTDMNGDGVVNAQDFQVFLNAFQGGC